MRYGIICQECNDLILSNAEENEIKKAFSEHKNNNPSHNMLILQKETIWEQAVKLGCPMLRAFCGNWVAVEKDPCPTKTCNMRGCHNFGMSFDRPERLKIIKSIDSYDFYEKELHGSAISNAKQHSSHDRTDHHTSTNEGKNEGLPGLTTSA